MNQTQCISKELPLSEYVKLVTGVIHLMTSATNGGVVRYVQRNVKFAARRMTRVTRSSAAGDSPSLIDERIDMHRSRVLQKNAACHIFRGDCVCY